MDTPRADPSCGIWIGLAKIINVITIMMRIEFDPIKSAKNERERGLPFDLASHLEWDRALVLPDDRSDYGEARMVALAPMQGRLYVVCYVMRDQVRRIISFRKANKREEQAYGQASANR